MIKAKELFQSVYLKGEEFLLSFLFVRCIWLKEGGRLTRLQKVVYDKKVPR